MPRNKLSRSSWISEKKYSSLQTVFREKVFAQFYGNLAISFPMFPILKTRTFHEMAKTFTAIDFETAHGKRWSVCQLGLARVEDGTIKKQLSILIQPPDNQYNSFNSNLHGIYPEMTLQAPTFKEVWLRVKPFIHGEHVVAHNMAFDNSCLMQTLAYYQLPAPVFTKSCTYQLYREKLSSLCKAYKISLDHHDALSDALACAKLYLRYYQQ